MSADRLALALPIDAARQFDATVTQTQLSNNTVLGSADDRDTFASYIEDAEDELRAHTSVQFRESRAGTPGVVESFPQVTYKVSGHNDFKSQWSRVGTVYDMEEVTKNLRDDRVLPFDSAEGDEAYFYRGLGGSAAGDEWEDVTDEYGDSWAIVDHRAGTVVFDPAELLKAMRGGSGISLARNRLPKLRFAISYRYGTLGGSRSAAGATTLGTSINDTDTGSTAVGDASRLPDAGVSGGTLILLIGEEYVRATVDPGADTIDIAERGVRGTTAASHSDGDRVQYTPPSIRKAVAARAGMLLAQAGRHQAFLPDAEDAIDKSDMIDEMRSVWDGTIEALAAD